MDHNLQSHPQSQAVVGVVKGLIEDPSVQIMINSTVIFARGKAIPQRGVTANYTAISATGGATPQPGVNFVHLMGTRKVLNIMLLKQRLPPCVILVSCHVNLQPQFPKEGGPRGGSGFISSTFLWAPCWREPSPQKASDCPSPPTL